MGGNIQSNTSNIKQDYMNNIVQTNQQSCQSKSVTVANDNIIIVEGAKIKGNFTGVSLGTSTDATCLMTSTMENNVKSILSAVQKQENQANTDLFNDGVLVNKESNTFNLDQTVVNNISQINQTICDAQNIQSTDANYIYLANSSVGGNFIGVSSNSSSKANCSMTNMMKNVVYNQQQASAAQGNKIVGMFAGILGSVVLIIGLIVLILIVMCTISAVSVGGHRSRHQEKREIKEEENENIVNQENMVALLNSQAFNNPALYR